MYKNGLELFCVKWFYRKKRQLLNQKEDQSLFCDAVLCVSALFHVFIALLQISHLHPHVATAPQRACAPSSPAIAPHGLTVSTVTQSDERSEPPMPPQQY